MHCDLGTQNTMVTLLDFSLRVLVVISGVVVSYSGGDDAALTLMRASPSNGATVSDLMGYMSSFGYLPKDDSTVGHLTTAHEMQDAIKRLQGFFGLPITGTLDETTANLIHKKRCGVPDISVSVEEGSRRKKRYTTFPTEPKWKKFDLTWSVIDYSRKVHASYIVRDLENAFQVWSAASRLTFRRVGGEDADIVIKFVSGYHDDNYPFDGDGNVLAHAYPPSSGPIGGDVHFDEDEPWEEHKGTQSSGKTSVYLVAVHEIGHSLGLGHSNEPTSLMYPIYQSHIDSDNLPYDDLMGIHYLYGSSRPHPPPRTESTRRVTRPTPPWRPPPTPRWQPPTPPPTRRTRPPYHGNGNRVPTRPTSSTAPTNIHPDSCHMSYDAISMIRQQELFIFKGKYYWRMSDSRTLPVGPHLITKFWTQLPQDIKHVDAVYERQKGDFGIVFFIGKQYWVFDATTLMAGYPRPLSYLGLPNSVKKIDAAFVWQHTGYTYLFSGDQYWRLNEDNGRVDEGYPKPLSLWKGVPSSGIDAVFQWQDGYAYFFKDLVFWKFGKDEVVESAPKLSAPYWMGCPSNNAELLHIQKGKAKGTAAHKLGNSAASARLQYRNLTLTTAMVLVQLLIFVFKNVLVTV